MYLFTLLIFIFFNTLVYGNDFIVQKIENLLEKNLRKGSKYSLTVFSTSKRDFLLKINSNTPLIPASTNKLFTTGMALLNLGKEFTIDTEIYINDNDLNDGIINGHIFIKGNGDPTITTNEFQKLIDQIKSRNIKAVTGNIVVDDSFFEETFYRNEWIENENISVPLPPISAITVNSNSIFIKITGNNKLNKPGLISFNDDLEDLQIINHTKTTKSRTRLSAISKFNNGKEVIVVNGTIRRNLTRILKVHIANPIYYAGNLFKKLLRENGINFWGEIKRGKVQPISNRIALISTPLVEILKPINKNSNNFYAEHLFLIIGGQYANGGGSPFDASQAIITTLKSLGIYEPSFNMVDGSGISRQNQSSTELIVKFLYHIYLNPLIFNDFYNSLSIPQSDGTLQNRFSNLIPPDRLRGKTGTLNGVTTLAGYLNSNSGDLLIFAINFNYSRGNVNKMREVQDEIITILTNLI